MYKVFIENRPLIITRSANTLLNLPIIETNNTLEIRDYLRTSFKNGFQVVTDDPSTFMRELFDDHIAIAAAGGAVVKDKKLLMIKRLGYWDLPKGKLNKSEAAPEGAIREVTEECGVRNLKITSTLPDTFHTYHVGESKFFKHTQWFAMSAAGEQILQPQLEEDITEVRWVSLEEVLDLAIQSYPSLIDLYNCIIQIGKVGI